MSSLRFVFLSLCFALLSACQSQTAGWPQPYPLSEKDVQTSVFKIHTRARLTDEAAPVTVYIEGDGYAWADKNTPSLNPTPRKAIGLRLAQSDGSANVIYLARACQYVLSDPSCEPRVWSRERYGPRATRAVEEALDLLLPRERPVHLVAFSGGAVAAVQVAAHRKQVLSLRTVAGNLDTRTLNAYHALSVDEQALNPIDFAARISALPQAHWSGEQDQTVPPFIARLFLGAMKTAPCAMLFQVREASHTQGWESVWPEVLADNPLDHCALEPQALFVLEPPEGD